jgi:hypothetical protein
MDILQDVYDETEQELKDILREYLDSEEKIQELHDKIVSKLANWGIDIYP